MRFAAAAAAALLPELAVGPHFKTWDPTWYQIGDVAVTCNTTRIAARGLCEQDSEYVSRRRTFTHLPCAQYCTDANGKEHQPGAVVCNADSCSERLCGRDGQWVDVKQVTCPKSQRCKCNKGVPTCDDPVSGDKACYYIATPFQGQVRVSRDFYSKEEAATRPEILGPAPSCHDRDKHWMSPGAVPKWPHEGVHATLDGSQIPFEMTVIYNPEGSSDIPAFDDWYAVEDPTGSDVERAHGLRKRPGKTNWPTSESPQTDFLPGTPVELRLVGRGQPETKGGLTMQKIEVALALDIAFPLCHFWLMKSPRAIPIGVRQTGEWSVAKELVARGSLQAHHVSYLPFFPVYNSKCCYRSGQWYFPGAVLAPGTATSCRKCTCAAGKWKCCTQRPELHDINAGTTRWGELLAYSTALKYHKRLLADSDGFKDDKLAQLMLHHNTWFRDAHTASWFLPWHRILLQDQEDLVMDAWMTIRGNDVALAQHGWPTHGGGALYKNEWYTHAGGLQSYIADPMTLCAALPWYESSLDSGVNVNTAPECSTGKCCKHDIGGNPVDSNGCSTTGQFKPSDKYFVPNHASGAGLPFSVSNPGHCSSLSGCTGILGFPGDTTVLNALSSPCNNFLQFADKDEHWIHDGGHGVLGGVMGSASSSFSHTFAMHHAFIDELWDRWQKQCSTTHDSYVCGTTDGYEVYHGPSGNSYSTSVAGTTVVHTDDNAPGTGGDITLTYPATGLTTHLGQTVWKKGCNDPLHPNAHSSLFGHGATTDDVMDVENLKHTCKTKYTFKWVTSSRWTGWMQRDGVSGTGDWETVAGFANDGINVCHPYSTLPPLNTQARQVTGDPLPGWLVYSVSALGYICKNADNNVTCPEAEVRFRCPYSYVQLIPSTECRGACYLESETDDDDGGGGSGSTPTCLQGSTTITEGPNDVVTINLKMDSSQAPSDQVEIKITGGLNRWIGAGFGASAMSGTYAVICEWSGSIYEQKLGPHNAGVTTTLSSLSSTSTTTGATTWTCTTKRPLAALSGQHYQFDMAALHTAGFIAVIGGTGTSPTLSYHDGNAAGTIALSPCGGIGPGDITWHAGKMGNLLDQLKAPLYPIGDLGMYMLRDGVGKDNSRPDRAAVVDRYNRLQRRKRARGHPDSFGSVLFDGKDPYRSFHRADGRPHSEQDMPDFPPPRMHHRQPKNSAFGDIRKALRMGLSGMYWRKRLMHWFRKCPGKRDVLLSMLTRHTDSPDFESIKSTAAGWARRMGTGWLSSDDVHYMGKGDKLHSLPRYPELRNESDRRYPGGWSESIRFALADLDRRQKMNPQLGCDNIDNARAGSRKADVQAVPEVVATALFSQCAQALGVCTHDGDCLAYVNCRATGQECCGAPPPGAYDNLVAQCTGACGAGELCANASQIYPTLNEPWFDANVAEIMAAVGLDVDPEELKAAITPACMVHCTLALNNNDGTAAGCQRSCSQVQTDSPQTIVEDVPVSEDTAWPAANGTFCKMPDYMNGSCATVHSLGGGIGQPFIPGNTRINVSCWVPAGLCDVFVWLYHDPRVGTSSTNGGLPAALLSSSWEASSCAPCFRPSGCDRTYSMVAYRTQIANGATIDVNLDSQATLAAVATVEGADCNVQSENECTSQSRCAWVDNSCVSNWCPKLFSGGSPGRPGTGGGGTGSAGSGGGADTGCPRDARRLYAA